jgi:hypothetical protein
MKIVKTAVKERSPDYRNALKRRSDELMQAFRRHVLRQGGLVTGGVGLVIGIIGWFGVLANVLHTSWAFWVVIVLVSVATLVVARGIADETDGRETE